MKANDKQLVIALQCGSDPAPFSELYDRFAPHIYRFVYFKIGSVSDAQDIVSEVFLKAWASIIEKKKGVTNFRAFIYTIARNQIVDFYRKKRQQIPIGDMVDEIIIAPMLVEKMQLNYDVEKILKILRTMKDEYRDVLMLRFMDEMSYKEIGQILQKSQVNVRVLSHRALKTLKERIESQL